MIVGNVNQTRSRPGKSSNTLVSLIIQLLFGTKRCCYPIIVCGLSSAVAGDDHLRYGSRSIRSFLFN
ncbi:hypothetical protein RCL_jg2706.t1 [Rhizophagus clarus]|uniref:Uncharacterized protein n=1 Tax=Rhizophagus clarus TaxID=94130 RepID=A0A8H3R1C9_9GLOM|nr:hypothetical protein RCL_jg2706.t1 [Rhizophagus clarus]